MNKVKKEQKYFFIMFFCCAVLLLPQNSNNQTYSVTYMCDLNTNASISQDSSFDETQSQLLALFIPSKVKLVYYILCDSNYMKIKGNMVSDSNETISFTNTSDDEAIIDLKNGLLYYYDSKQIAGIKKYTAGKMNEDKIFLTEKGTSVFIKYDTSLPAFVSPFPFINNISYGIKELVTPKMRFYLVDSKINSHQLIIEPEILNAFKEVKMNAPPIDFLK
jgi:hypothetical protein